jgi:hypothetical protein
MSIDSTASCPSQRGSLSCNATTVFAVLAAMTFSASGAAPTPPYQEYQIHFGLTPFMITVIFAIDCDLRLYFVCNGDVDPPPRSFRWGTIINAFRLSTRPLFRQRTT